MIWDMPICDDECLQIELHVLLQINSKLNGKDWITKWDTHANHATFDWIMALDTDANDTKLNTSLHCDWYGILCDNETKHIMSIDLSNNNVYGELPVNLSNLQFLLSFRIGSNSIHGVFDQIIPAMPMNLIRLDISNSDIGGRIPEDIANNVPILSKLQLSDSKLSREIPDSIGSLIHLTVLSLGKTKLTGSIPQSISKLTKIWFLDLEGLKLEGNLLFLYNLRNLSYLHLLSNEISGQIPEYIGESCPNLRELRLSNNKLSGGLPRSLGNLKWLEELNVEKNRLSGLIPADLLTLNLKILILSSNKFTGFERSSNGTFKSLTLFRASRLTAFNCSLDTIVSYLKGSEKSIMQIDVSYSNIYGQIPSLIYSFDKLTFLKLESNKLSGSIPAPLRNLPFLTLLDLKDNDLSGSIPMTLSRLHVLTELNVLGNKRLRGSIPSSFMVLDYQVGIKERESDTCPVVRFAHNNGTIYVDSRYYDRRYCYCNENFFGNGMYCKRCMPGGFCPGTKTSGNRSLVKQLTAEQVQPQVSNMFLKQGYFPLPVESDVKSIVRCPSSGDYFKICVPKDNCRCYVNSTEEFNRTVIHCNKSCLCPVGHQGRLCSQCIEGYYKDRIHCYECLKKEYLGVTMNLFIIVVLIIISVLLIVIATKWRRLGIIFELIEVVVTAILVFQALIPVVYLHVVIIMFFMMFNKFVKSCATLGKIAMLYFQIMDILISKTEVWPNFIYNIQIFVFSGFNIRFSSLACLLPIDSVYMADSLILLVLPLACIALLWLFYCWFRRCAADPWDPTNVCRKYSLVIIDLAYFPVVENALAILAGCRSIAGVSFLKAYAWIDCNSDERTLLTGIAGVVLFIYIVIIPCLIGRFLFLTHGEETKGKWLSPLTELYKEYAWFVPVIMLLLRAVIAACLTVLPKHLLVHLLVVNICFKLLAIFQFKYKFFQGPKVDDDNNKNDLENYIASFMLICISISFDFVGFSSGRENSLPLVLLITTLAINSTFLAALCFSMIYRFIGKNFSSKVISIPMGRLNK